MSSPSTQLFLYFSKIHLYTGTVNCLPPVMPLKDTTKGWCLLSWNFREAIYHTIAVGGALNSKTFFQNYFIFFFNYLY